MGGWLWEDSCGRTVELLRILFVNQAQSIGKEELRSQRKLRAGDAYCADAFILRWKPESFMKFL